MDQVGGEDEVPLAEEGGEEGEGEMDQVGGEDEVPLAEEGGEEGGDMALGGTSVSGIQVGRMRMPRKVSGRGPRWAAEAIRAKVIYLDEGSPVQEEGERCLSRPGLR
ncbi:uncharacterized protein A4U43_C04F30140 [Asparagus officinalis]|uniref:Uncharacterized protein n=1 Tax=Asparagus officinalis TaxID=4686 RepID=A0A5P1F9Z7_ASPOF|nr:uncharacterized protein A4U43_C04F30140 [Asparagus officinalis]